MLWGAYAKKGAIIGTGHVIAYQQPHIRIRYPLIADFSDAVISAKQIIILDKTD